MDLQTYLNNAVKAQRQESLANSDQLTLGELILKLESIVAKQADRIKEGQEEATVRYDFEYLFPTCFDSWRGIYAELALNFVDNNYAPLRDVKELKVSDFLQLCKDTVGREFTGYKGGEYIMNRHTPIWVANYGNSGNTALIDVVDDSYIIILITGYRET